MIVGVGTDIVDVARIEKTLTRFGRRFSNKILCVEEIRPALKGQQAAAYLARQFAAKEAVSKVLGTGMRRGVHFRTIRVLRNAAGEPTVELLAGAAKRASQLEIAHIHLSMSDEKAFAVAFAVGESG